MKVTKRKLRQIIREEKQKLIKENRLTKEAGLMTDLDSITSAIEDIASGMYGLEDPGDRGAPAGDEMAEELLLQVSRLNDFYQKIVSHFESMDTGPEMGQGEIQQHDPNEDPYGANAARRMPRS
jgi:hypothetical protein